LEFGICFWNLPQIFAAFVIPTQEESKRMLQLFAIVRLPLESFGRSDGILLLGLEEEFMCQKNGKENIVFPRIDFSPCSK